jgi:hypothetical protein
MGVISSISDKGCIVKNDGQDDGKWERYAQLHGEVIVEAELRRVSFPGREGKLFTSCSPYEASH